MTTALSREPITTIDPTTARAIARHDLHLDDEIERRLTQSAHAYREWSATDLPARLALLRRLAAYFRAQKERLASLITLEMGKAIVESEAEIEKCAWACEYYSEHAERQLAPEVVDTNAKRSYIAYRPLGIVLAVMPWNFPFFQVIRFAVPALAAGNVALLKHAANVTGCGLAIEAAFKECGFPSGVFTVLVVRASAIEAIVADRRIAAVTLTGSELAGSSVGAAAAKHLKKSVLELGGSDAYIVLADADVEAAAKTAVRARFQNCGQSCIAAKRFIVEASVYEEFYEAFAENAKNIAVGNPFDRTTAMGPLARRDLVDDLERQVRESQSMGARTITGGSRIDGAGAFFEPTVLVDVEPEMPVFREETFGPAAAVSAARDVNHAVELANASSFGLGNSVWTRDLALGEEIASRLQSGLVFINSMTASDPRLPFGGVKRSGYGRELSHFGVREFTNVQTISVQDAL
jgi:succinate-semialdehyde dehydrogenase/glutarate-semialdehyde dehydrogenase